jgi:hypothetical protein
MYRADASWRPVPEPRLGLLVPLSSTNTIENEHGKPPLFLSAREKRLKYLFPSFTITLSGLQISTKLSIQATASVVLVWTAKLMTRPFKRKEHPILFPKSKPNTAILAPFSFNGKKTSDKHNISVIVREEQRRFIRTGISEYDDIIGGLIEGTVTLIYGPPASGKSLLAVAFTRSLLAAGYEGIFVDSDLSLSQKLVRAVSNSHLRFVRPLSFSEYRMIIYSAAFYLKRGRFLTVDSISFHERGLSEGSLATLTDLMKALAYLKDSTLRSGGLVIMTAQTVRGEAPTPKFSMLFSDVAVKVTRIPEVSEIEMVCVKHPNTNFIGKCARISVNRLAAITQLSY